jgi:hypothetical protein
LSACPPRPVPGCGQGLDAGRPGAKEQGRWRRQALQWRRAELAVNCKRLETNNLGDRQRVVERLRSWQRAQALAGLRDPKDVASLTVEEQTACRQLWAEVQTLLGKAAPDR